MRKDVTRKRYSEKRALQSRRRLVYVVIFLLLLAGIGAGIFYYQKKAASPDSPHYFVTIKNWLTERKNHLQKGLTKAKQITANKETEKPPEQIHFEFYTALPNMHIEPPAKPPTERTDNDK